LGLTQPPSQPAPALHSWCSCHMGSSSSQRANTASECSHQCTVVQTKVTSYVIPSWHGHCCVAAPAHHLLYTLFGVGCLFVRGVWVIFVSPPCGFACPVPCTILQVVGWAGQCQGTARVDPQEGECAAASPLLAAGRLRDYCILLCGGMACKVDRAGHMPHPVAPFNPPTPEARCCVRYVSEVGVKLPGCPYPCSPPPSNTRGMWPL
jgi:hypothetical protein